MDIKAVIFDLDGVIVCTDRFHYIAWKKIADSEGIFFDEAINNKLRGVSRMESLEIILENASRLYTADEKTALAEKKNAIYVQALQKLNRADVLPGVLQVICGLAIRRIHTAIGSSSKNARLILKQIGLENAFDSVADGTEIKHSKPCPDVFLKAAEKLHMPPKDCLVVEDSVAGIQAAKAASMFAAAIGDAVRSPLADYRLSSITELMLHI